MKQLTFKIVLVLFFFCYQGVELRGEVINQDKKIKINDEISLFEELAGVKKKTDKLNLFIDMHSSFDMSFNKGFQKGTFGMRECRLEARGFLTNWLSYRFRQKLNSSNDGSNQMDRMPSSIDVAFLSLKLSNRVSLTLGKQFAAFGGIEFDLNPIEVYEYSDMIDHSIGFMTGAMVSILVAPQQILNIQIVNNRDFREIIDQYGVDVEDSKMPFAYTLNWNGKFSDYFSPRWSISYMDEAKKKNMYFLSLGNQFELGSFGGYFDFMYSKEDLDQKGIVNSIINKNLSEDDVFLNLGAEYLSYVLELNYQIKKKWNVFVKGSYETARLGKEFIKEGRELDKGEYRATYGYSSGLEYYPFDESNLHFFLTYVGKSHRYTSLSKKLGWENDCASRVSLGFIYHLPLF